MTNKLINLGMIFMGLCILVVVLSIIARMTIMGVWYLSIFEIPLAYLAYYIIKLGTSELIQEYKKGE